jgi:hypothetical protein
MTSRIRKGYHDVDEFYPEDDIGDAYSHDYIDEVYSGDMCSPDSTGFRTCMRCYSLEERVDELEKRLDSRIDSVNGRIDAILAGINPVREDNYNRKNLERIEELLDNIHESVVSMINPPGLIRQIITDCNEIRDIVYILKHKDKL